MAYCIIFVVKFSKDEITCIADGEVLETNIEGNPKYDWIDVVAIPPRPTDLRSNLFLATHSTGEGGWNYGFDRRPAAAKIAYDKGWHLGIEPCVDVDGAAYLMVRSLDTLAQKLFAEARERSNPYVVGITGSVGKTTTVAFLEHLIRTAGYEVARFYSKRLTPLSTMCHYINRVEENTPFVVMEYSAYLKDHVAQLSEILPPNIAFLANIYETHLNPDMFKSKRDIFSSKVRIKPEKSIGFVNARVLNELHLDTPNDWGNFDVEFPEGLHNLCLPPTLRTAELYTIGKLFAQEVNFPHAVLKCAYESFEPAESRIITCNYRGKNVFFHGETSGGSRLYSWFETLTGECPWLMVEEVNFADEDPQGFSNLLERVFDSDKTFVLDTPLNRERLSVTAHFVGEHVFNQLMQDKVMGYVVYHKALAARQPNFEPERYLNDRW